MGHNPPTPHGRTPVQLTVAEQRAAAAQLPDATLVEQLRKAEGTGGARIPTGAPGGAARGPEGGGLTLSRVRTPAASAWLTKSTGEVETLVDIACGILGDSEEGGQG